ncbi:hypothetical protein ASE21_06830 [Flavobacterium sp. Root901]|uniref:RHS repeat domain-containing protein n=1 Tax=Flavobacterium sp. Root901 TaxID=1736605 RepID=UPI00070BBE12|nr:RHS repeat-associated core domain-containing protein [Flavobacterium sp. Root901]KRD11415.1 hypothetical protein ASE21_06830 [Flavobacterium sp. Root901]
MTKDVFTYSAQDRLLTQTHQINSGTIELMAGNNYDELGQLVSKKVGNTAAAPTQNVNYTYNIRGWLTAINNVNALSIAGDPKDLFAFKLNYNTATTAGVSALYNGNISETYWTSNNSETLIRGYGYVYDNLNRLKTGISKQNGTVNNYYDETLTYDKNGNILTLARNGDPAAIKQIDNLAYSYGTGNSLNQLTKVVDNATTYKAGGFVDSAANTVDDYSYDANGNMTKDNNKNITVITYNHLNLPTKITFATTGNIVYLYNAGGQKVQKIVTITSPSSVTTTDYLGGYQYDNGSLKFFPTAEGYVEPVSGSYKYIYQYKDHLGNIRVSYDKTLAIKEESNFYPFGLKQEGYNSVKTGVENKFKYNSKELQDELGLNFYDYGWRNYDPAIGRWMNTDPLAEFYVGITPYSYTFNNPVRFIDPDGRYVDDSYIYQKYTSGKHKGEYKNPNLVKAWEAFASSKTGIAFLANFAEKNQVIAGHKYEESGKYDKNNTDLNFGSLEKGDVASGRTSHEQKGKHLQLTIMVDASDVSSKIFPEAIAFEIDNIAHESFAHVDSYAEDFFDDGNLNFSNVLPEYVKAVNDQIKSDPAKGRKGRSNVLQHWMEQYNQTFNKKTFPILKEFYKNANIKKSDADIKRMINTYQEN